MTRKMALRMAVRNNALKIWRAAHPIFVNPYTIGVYPGKWYGLLPNRGYPVSLKVGKR